MAKVKAKAAGLRRRPGPEPATAGDPRRDEARPHAFISYAREQKAFVTRLEEALRQSGHSAWVDSKDIRPSADWRAKVLAGIEQSKTFVSVLSPDSLASEVCEEERVHAHDCHKRLIPILRVDVDGKAVPPALAAPNWIYLRDQDDFDAGVRALVDAIDTDVDWLDTHARLLVRATEWRQNRSDRSFLLRGRDLVAAERWLSERNEHRELPTQLHEAYVRQSRRASKRRRRFLAGATALAVTVAAVLSVAGWGQRETSRSRSEAARALGQIPFDPWQALQTAVRAAEISDTPEAMHALRMSLDAPRERQILREPHGGAIHSARFDDDAQHVVTTAFDGTVRRWRLDDGTSEVLGTAQKGQSTRTGKPTDLRPDGQFEVLALGGGVLRGGEDDLLRKAAPGGGVVRVVSARSTAPRTERPAFLERANLGEGIEGVAPSVDFSPDGRHFLAVGYDGTARVWGFDSVHLGEEVAVAVAISRDGSQCATLSEQSTVTIWRCADGARVREWTLEVPASQTRKVQPGDVSMSFSSDGARLLVSVQPLRATSIWETATKKKLGELQAQGRSPASVNRKGTLALIDNPSNGPQVLDVTTKEARSTLGRVEKGIGVGVFSDDDLRLVTSNRGEDVVRLWDVRTGEELPSLGPFPGPVEDVDISLDGTMVVTASGKSPQLWTVGMKGHPRELRGHSDAVYASRFSPDGEFIVTGGGDGMARVWDTGSGEEVMSTRGDNWAVLQAGMSTDHRLITVGTDDTALVSSCPACRAGAALLREARAALAHRPR